jgi:hypothetical protein
MNLTIKAILARCDGDWCKAVQYCAEIATTYPHLRNEYEAYALTLIAETKAEAAHAN